MFVNGLENLILHVMFHEESMHMRQPVIENNAQTLNSERESPFQAYSGIMMHTKQRLFP